MTSEDHRKSDRPFVPGGETGNRARAIDRDMTGARVVNRAGILASEPLEKAIDDLIGAQRTGLESLVGLAQTAPRPKPKG
jgi:hypothetical protein